MYPTTVIVAGNKVRSNQLVFRRKKLKDIKVSEDKEKERMGKIISLLEKNVRSDCALEYTGDPWKLAVMARLSAQCTDLRVNQVSKRLFEVYPDADSMAKADPTALEKLVMPCGLYRVKAANIKKMSEIIAGEYGGKVPCNMEQLLKLPGVGRKIANLIRGDLFGLGGIVADTHCIRICGRLGFYPQTLKDAVKVEKILTPLVPVEKQTDFCHRLVWFGRETCNARNPKCAGCPLSALCAAFTVNKENNKSGQLS